MTKRILKIIFAKNKLSHNSKEKILRKWWWSTPGQEKVIQYLDIAYIVETIYAKVIYYIDLSLYVLNLIIRKELSILDEFCSTTYESYKILFEVWTSLTFESWPNLIKYVNKTMWDFSKMILRLFYANVKIWKMLNSTYEKNISSKECQFEFEQQKQQALKGSNSKKISR